MKRDAVVRPDRLDLQPERLSEPCGERKRPRRVHARTERRQDAPRSALVEQVLVAKTCERLLLAERDELSRRLADRLAELVGAADALALPERNCSRHTWSRRDEDAVTRDLFDAPGRRAEQEGLAGPRFVDHLLVELADSAAAVDEVDAEEPAVRNRSCIRHGQPAAAGATADNAGGAIPDDARPELGELVGRITAGEHVQHVLELCT